MRTTSPNGPDTLSAVSAFRVALVAVGATIVTAACAAGQHAITAEERPSIDGTQGTVGPISLNGVALRAPNGAQSYPAGASVPLKISIANNGNSADSLTSITSPSFTGWGIVASAHVSSVPTSPTATPATSPTASPTAGPSIPPAKPQTIQPGGALRFGFMNLTPSGAQSPKTILLKGLRSVLFPADSIKITFTFAKAGSTTLTVPVQLLESPSRQTVPETGD